MPRFIAALVLVAAAATLATPTSAGAQGCRAQAIMASQCTWFALEELGGDRTAVTRAQTEATSSLIDGCSPGEYQMVLLRGTTLPDAVVARLRQRGSRHAAAVRAECEAEASRIAQR